MIDFDFLLNSRRRKGKYWRAIFNQIFHISRFSWLDKEIYHISRFPTQWKTTRAGHLGWAGNSGGVWSARWVVDLNFKLNEEKISFHKIGFCNRCVGKRWLHQLESSSVETDISSVNLASETRIEIWKVWFEWVSRFYHLSYIGECTQPDKTAQRRNYKMLLL